MLCYYFRKQNVDLQSIKEVLRVFGGRGQPQEQGGEQEEGLVPQAGRDVGRGSCSKPGKLKGVTHIEIWTTNRWKIWPEAMFQTKAGGQSKGNGNSQCREKRHKLTRRHPTWSQNLMILPWKKRKCCLEQCRGRWQCMGNLMQPTTPSPFIWNFCFLNLTIQGGFYTL